MNTQTATAPTKFFAAAALLGAAALTVVAFGGSSAANAQATAPAASVVADSGASLHDGVDWSKVAIVPASPAQSVAAYDR